ncbi:MAG: hypothetical protein AAGF01_02135 [Cyanobacteria bacterium P01_G01_bin.38]
MPSAVDQQIRQLSEQLVHEIAPKEVILFQATSDAYFKDPEATLKETQKAPSDDLMGFGAGGAVILLTPIILEVTKTALKLAARLGQQAVEDAVSERLQAETSGFLGKVVGLLRKLLGQPEPPAQVERLTPAQLEAVRQAALSRAQALGLDNTKAVLLADALVGKLALANA